MDLNLIADKTVVDERTKKCDACPFKKGLFCSKCGCLLSAKILYIHSKCPIGEWENGLKQTS